MTARRSNFAPGNWLFVVLLAWAAPLWAQPNGWTNLTSGKWENGANWVLGVPPSTSDFYDNIFNGGTATIDATTSGSFPGTLTVNNVAIAGSPSSLQLNNAGTSVPLHVLNIFELDSVSSPYASITNSALQVDGLMVLGYPPSMAGDMEFASGWITASNLTLGHLGTGNLFMDGGTLTVLGAVTNGELNGGSGTILMSAGTLVCTNNPIVLGNQGFGQLGMTGGTVQALGFQLGGSDGSQGRVAIYGGTVTVSSNILLGDNICTNPCSVTVSNGGALYVTNSSQTAYINVASNATLTLGGGSLVVDSLILTNGSIFNDLAGTLLISKPIQLANGGGVTLSNCSVTTSSNFTLAVSLNSTSYLAVVDGGTLNVSNATLGIANDGTISGGAGAAAVSVSNGIINAAAINLGSTAGGSGSLTLRSNGVVNVASNLTVVSGSLSTTSTVTIADSTLSVTNGTIGIGSAGAGRMDISGSVTAKRLQAGGAPGTASGAVYLLPGGILSSPSVSANLIVVGGGELDSGGGDVTIGENHDAEVDVNSGSALAATMYVGYTPGFTGTYIQSGGTVVVTNAVIVGDCVNGASGVPILNGGALYITNATQTAVLDVRNGTFVLNPGSTLVVDTLILTNACGHFVNLGGTLLTTHPPVLAPNLDADGDGQSNAAELLAGTDPLDPRSVFELTSATIQNGHVLVSWTTEGGHSYVVQTSGGLGPGTFRDFSPVITVPPGIGAGITNYLHTGAATNPAAYYRVRLGP